MEAVGQGGRATLEKAPGCSGVEPPYPPCSICLNCCIREKCPSVLEPLSFWPLSQQPNGILINTMSLSPPFLTAETETRS